MWTTIVAEPGDRSRWARGADAAAVACGETEHLDLTLRAARQAWLVEPTDTRAMLLDSVARRIEGPWAEAVRRHVDAVSCGDGAVLMDLASRLVALGRVLDAAVVADSAAHAHLAADESRAALLAAFFADEQLARCGQPAVFHRRPPIVAPSLSPREHEIAEYAAEGWSNREIASRVHLSVRTVEGHVLNACTKLGVRDRSELALLLAGARQRRA
jgi:DNA-binding CsgD family transcriptional regulator